MKSKVLLLVASVGLLFGAACTPAQKGAMVGGGVGAAAGQIIGGDTEATLIGGAVGALGGAIVNDAVDNTKRSSYEDGYYQGQASRRYTPRAEPYESRPDPYYNTSPR